MEILKSKSQINKMESSLGEFTNRLELAQERIRESGRSIENTQSEEHRGKKRIKKN